MKHTYIKPLFIMALLGLSATVYAQTDTDTTTAEDDVEMPYPSVEVIEEAAEEEGVYEVMPDYEAVPEYAYEAPKAKKWDFQTRFAFGFVSLNNAIAPVSPGNNNIGRYLPKAKFISSNISSFEIAFGRNISDGLWRFWFGVGIEDEYFNFDDANVRISARSDSFSHYSVNNLSTPMVGNNETSKSSSLSFATVTVPLAIGYQNKARRPLYKIQAGAYVGYRFQTQSDVEYEDKTTVSIRGDFHANPIIIDPYISVLYKKIGFFARTSLMPLLNNVGAGNEQTRNAFGITFGI